MILGKIRHAIWIAALRVAVSGAILSAGLQVGAGMPERAVWQEEHVAAARPASAATVVSVVNVASVQKLKRDAGGSGSSRCCSRPVLLRGGGGGDSVSRGAFACLRVLRRPGTFLRSLCAALRGWWCTWSLGRSRHRHQCSMLLRELRLRPYAAYHRCCGQCVLPRRVGAPTRLRYVCDRGS